MKIKIPIYVTAALFSSVGILARHTYHFSVILQDGGITLIEPNKAIALIELIIILFSTVSLSIFAVSILIRYAYSFVKWAKK